MIALDPTQPQGHLIPKSKGWTQGPSVNDEHGPIGTVYLAGLVRVIAARDNASYPDGSGEIGPQDHLSVSYGGRRAPDRIVDFVRAAFGLEDAEEDNHHPGVARHLWRPVDPRRRVTCECKATETTIVETDGWTNPTDAECRGCTYARNIGGGTCPIHGVAEPPARR